MNIDKKVSAKQGHPCTGCPYIFVLFCKLNDAPVVTLNDAITV